MAHEKVVAYVNMIEDELSKLSTDDEMNILLNLLRRATIRRQIFIADVIEIVTEALSMREDEQVH